MRVLFIGFMLFALFFGAGNLIYPVADGQLTGSNFFIASLGFVSTGVILPLLGVISLSISGEENLLKLSQRGGWLFGLIFTTALYLTIGPLFAMPRTGVVSFDISFSGNKEELRTISLLVYSVIFFGISAFFSLRPSKIVDIIGKFLTPALLLFILILVLLVVFNPISPPETILPENYQGNDAVLNYYKAPFITGFVNGYLTLDALGALVFGLIVVNSVMGYGIKEKSEILTACIKSSLIAAALLAIIYIALFYVGAISEHEQGGAFDAGATILSSVSLYYLDSFGHFVLAIIVILACLTTNIGLTCSLSYYFNKLIGHFSYVTYVWIFSVISLVFSNFGLDFITQLSVPVLLVLYPIAIVMILLTFLHPLFHGRAVVYYATYTMVTVLSILFTAISYLKENEAIKSLNDTFAQSIPFYQFDLGWVIPVALTFIISYIFVLFTKKTA